MTKYGKLVRDNIPEIIAAQGRTAVVRVLSDAEYLSCLNAKLLEEVNEYLQDNCLEELADILEVIYALAWAHGYQSADVQAVKTAKADKNGRFEKRLYLEEIRSS